MNGCRHSAQTLIKDGMQRVGLWRFFWGRHRLARGGSRVSVLCRCILRPVDTSDAPAGTSLHRRPLHCRPARIATVPAFSSFRTPSSVAHRHRFFSLVFPFRRLSFSVPHGGDHPCRVSHAMGGDPSCRSPSVALFLPEFSPPPFSPHLFIIIFCISFFINEREICR